MKSFFPLSCFAVQLLIPGLLSADNGEPFSIVSMTLHDEALARAHDVELSGDIAFVPGKDQSLSIIDVSDPEKPEILWFKHDEDIPDAETVLPVGDHLWLGTRDFLTLDVKDPRKPVILGTVSDRTRIDKINGMVLIEDIVFAANKHGYLNAFDISDPKNPKLAGALETAKSFGLRFPHDIARLGDHVVIVDPAKFVPPEGRLGVFRVVKEGVILPASEWTLAGKISCPELIGANRVQVTGHYAIIGGGYSPKGRELAKQESGKSFSARVSIVDLSSPADPTIVASLPFPDDRGPNGLTIAGDVVFGAGGQTIAAYDISDPTHPTLLASQRFPIYRKAERTDNYHDLIYRDGLLYISAQSDNGFLILKVDDNRILELSGTE